MRGYDIDDPARHLPFPKLRTRSGWGLLAPQTYGGDLQLRLPVMASAACAGADPELFFNPADKISAIRICLRCPAREQCLSEAMKPNEIDGRTVYPPGVWGGTTESQRELMRRGEYEAEALPERMRVRRKRPPKPIVVVESDPIPLSGYDRMVNALRAGRIVIDRGDDPPLILPPSATGIAERLESQGCKRLSLQDLAESVKEVQR